MTETHKSIDLQILKKEIEILTQTLHQRSAENAALTSKCSRFERMLNSLEKELKRMKKTESKLLSTIESLQGKMELETQQNRKLEEKFKRKIVELEDWVNEFARMESQLREKITLKNDKIRSLTNALTEANDQKQQLEESLRIREQKADRAKSIIESKDAQIAKNENYLKQLFNQDPKT